MSDLMTTGLRAYTILLAFLLGSVFASFITCVAYRTVKGESWIRGRSHCDVCGHELEKWDLVPIVSYAALHGRCRYCGAKIPGDSTVAEITLGLAWVGLVLRFGLSLATVEFMGLATLLLGLSVADFMSYEIPDGFIFSGLIWYAATLAAGGIFKKVPVGRLFIDGIIGAVAIAGGLLVISLIFDKITGKESLGGGDIKLFFMLGWYLGWKKGLLNLIVACLVGLLMAATSRREKIPFGPAISIASYVTIILGDPVIHWYLGLF